MRDHDDLANAACMDPSGLIWSVYCDWLEEEGDPALSADLRVDNRLTRSLCDHVDGYGNGYGNGGDGDGDGDPGGGDGGFGGFGCGDGSEGSGGYGGAGGDGLGKVDNGYGNGGDGGFGCGGGGGAVGYGDGDDNGGGFGAGAEATVFNQEKAMKSGELAILSQPGGYYPYVLVGWCQQIAGLEWELVGARVLRRYGQGQALATLAARGPAPDTQLLPAAALPERIWRPNVVRCIPCNPSAWARDCPRPEDWKE